MLHDVMYVTSCIIIVFRVTGFAEQVLRGEQNTAIHEHCLFSSLSASLPPVSTNTSQPWDRMKVAASLTGRSWRMLSRSTRKNGAAQHQQPRKTLRVPRWTILGGQRTFYLAYSSGELTKRPRKYVHSGV